MSPETLSPTLAVISIIATCITLWWIKMKDWEEH